MNSSNNINNSIIDVKEVISDTETVDNADIVNKNKPVSKTSDCDTLISQVELFDLVLWPDNKKKYFIDTVIKSRAAKIDIEIILINRHFSKNCQIRTVENNQTIHRHWFVYSKSFDRAFCFWCKLFNTLNSSLGTIGNTTGKIRQQNLFHMKNR